MGPGGQYTFQNGGLQLYPATSWILTVLFICKLGSSAFTFVATQFGIFQEPPQILVHGLFGLDLAYCLSYHLCLKLLRMLGVPLKNIVQAVELLLNIVCFIYIYTFKTLLQNNFGIFYNVQAQLLLRNHFEITQVLYCLRNHFSYFRVRNKHSLTLLIF